MDKANQQQEASLAGASTLLRVLLVVIGVGVGGLLSVLVGLGLALAVLNPQNPYYDPQAKAGLERQAATVNQSGDVATSELWLRLLRSASAECHYRDKPQEFLISGSLPDQYIAPNTGLIKWYVRFAANHSRSLFNDTPPPLTAQIVTLQQFWGIIKTDKFTACSPAQATTARILVGL